MLLGHQTSVSITNLYKILQSGYLKSGKEVGKRRLIGDQPFSKYIFLTLLIPRELQNLPHFELSIDLLLDNISYLDLGWNGEPSSDAIKVKGSKMNKTQLNKIIKDYINDMKEEGDYSHEILVENKINLKKYLKAIRIDNCMKKYKTCKKLLKLLKNKYPNVKIVSLSQMKNKYK
jgi:hypothetical protein